MSLRRGKAPTRIPDPTRTTPLSQKPTSGSTVSSPTSKAPESHQSHARRLGQSAPTAKTPRMAKWGRPTHPTGPRPDTADTASAGPRAPFHRANHPPLAAGLQPSSHEPLPGRARVPSQCRHKSLLPPLYGLDRAREERAQRRGIQTGPVLGNDATDDIYDLKLKSVPGCLAPGGYNLREPVRGVKCEEVLFEAWSKCKSFAGWALCRWDEG